MHRGEIDLILVLPGAAGADVLVFCEVKARAGSEFGGPEGAVNWAKQRRLRRLAATWLAAEKPAAWSPCASTSPLWWALGCR